MRMGEGEVFRLANKRLKQVVESCTICLTSLREEDGPDSLPIPMIQRCRRIDDIRCLSHNLRSLEGCPDGLKKLSIGEAPHLSDLSPLASCFKMESLVLTDSSVTDISVVSSMLLLNVFACYKGDQERPSIKDLSPLSSCPQLKVLFLTNNRDLEDLSPLSDLSYLEILDISFSPLITSLTPLSSLMGLKHLGCYAVDPETSLLSLSSCTGLERLDCNPDAIDLEELR